MLAFEHVRRKFSYFAREGQVLTGCFEAYQIEFQNSCAFYTPPKFCATYTVKMPSS